MIPLGLLGPGERGEILAIRINKKTLSDQCCSEREKYDCRVEDMGLRVGKLVEMLTNGGGPVLVLGGACWLLYHSLWKKKGHCPGGCSGSCNSKTHHK